MENTEHPLKRPGIVEPSASKAATKPGDMGFAKGEFKSFDVLRKRQPKPIDDMLGLALAQVDLSPTDVQAPVTSEAPHQVGDLVQAQVAPCWIDVNKLKVWKGNPRHVIDPVKLHQLAESIAEHGQSEPIDVIEDPDTPGHYLILGGQRRYLAVKMRGLQEGKLLARVRVGMPSPEVLIAAAVETQVNTDPLQDIDFAITLALSQDEIGVRALSRVIDKSHGEISKLRQIGSLSPLLLDYMKENAQKFTSLFAYEVTRVCDKMGEKCALEFARSIVSKNLSHKATLAAKESLLGIRQPAKRSSWNTIRYSVGGVQAGSMRQKESTGEIAVKLKGLNPEGMALIQEAIKKATEFQAKEPAAQD